MMTVEQYLRIILARESVDTGPNSPARQVASRFAPALTSWAGQYLLGTELSGSFAKGTAVRSSTDVDIFISISPDVPSTLKEIYDTLAKFLTSLGHAVRRQNVSIGICVDGINIDLVPARRQDMRSQDHSLYRRKADTWTQTNVYSHIDYVKRCARQDEIKIVKTWRNQKGLEFPSFYIELAIIRALHGSPRNNLVNNIWTVFSYLQSDFFGSRFQDPANANNFISDDLNDAERRVITQAASRALSAKDWTEIVK